MKLSNIPTHTFNQIVKELIGSGWNKIEEYDAFDAWIDYGKVVLSKDGATLQFEWDNWMEGELDGPDAIVQGIRTEFGLE